MNLVVHTTEIEIHEKWNLTQCLHGLILAADKLFHKHEYLSSAQIRFSLTEAYFISTPPKKSCQVSASL